MSAVFVLPQSTAVHMITDAVDYTKEGVVHSVNLVKAQVVATLPVAISATGPGSLGPLLADRIAGEFESFDDLIARGSDWLAGEFNRIADDHLRGDASSSMYLIGWHHQANRPAAYAVNLWSDKSTLIQQVLARSPNAGDAEATRSKLIEMISIAGTPLPSEEMLNHCCFEFKSTDDYDDVDLLHLMEVARQQRYDGAHWVGGKALLTTIDSDGVRQRVIHHWTEDRPSQKIQPTLIADWKAWRASRSAPSEPSTLSRLKREMLERKARKANR